MLVAVQTDVRALAHQPMKQPGEFREPADALDPASLSRFIPGKFMAFPKLQLRSRLTQKKNFPMFFLVGIRIEQQNRLLLLDATEIKQIGVGRHAAAPVSIGGEDIVGIDHSKGIGRYQFREAISIRREQLRRDLFVAHVHQQNANKQPDPNGLN